MTDFNHCTSCKVQLQTTLCLSASLLSTLCYLQGLRSLWVSVDIPMLFLYPEMAGNANLNRPLHTSYRHHAYS